ncbi:hypothetical protein GCM10010124_19330 [Pilimelia terevasa]|uniref:Uncharacterized protein n=1 Tax=Pilimelia terevasa TaxID=53372 RepID=A0A8J3BPM8_9ACTN|nr:hypothetical protein [Pilimelia terevasa]GGK26787.1 hypothetical protein GCM10010124_19330 [Pilimelia terevasa]
MNWFRRRKASSGHREGQSDAFAHLGWFVQNRYGVEAYLEPRTVMTETTVILIAHDGEWTRRRVRDPEAAARFARKMSIPLYDVQLTGYPQRMRDYNARRRLRPDAPHPEV